MTPDVYEFDRFRIDVAKRTVFRDGQSAPLSPKVFDTLLELVRRRGQVMTKDQLLAAVWPDAVVEENSLARNISVLRKFLGESAADHRYIVTMPGKGYSFVAAVREGNPSKQAPAAWGSEGAQTRAVPPVLGLRRALGFGVLLATVAAAAWFFVSFKRIRALHFEMTIMTKLTSAGQSFKAAISPDGRYIAHTAFTSGEESLRVRRATTLHDIEIVPPAPVRYLGITFSPDSETVYYVTHTAGPEPAVLHQIPVMGGSPLKLKEGFASPITLSPDGRRFAFVRESAGESTLMVADLDSGSDQKLVSRTLPEVLDYPAWSPDGRIIACTAVDSSIISSTGSDARIIEVRVADRMERALSAQTWGFIRQLAWLGDGHGLVMSARSQESGTYHVWYVSYPGGGGRELTNGLNSQVGVSVSADSRQIVTVEESMFSGIWRMGSTGSQDDLEPVSSGSSDASASVWTPDNRIVFERELNGQRSIWIVNADGTDQKQFTMIGNNSSPSISGNGRMLAYISDRNGSPAIWTMDIDGGNQTMVVKADPAAFPQLSPDEKWIALAAVGSGKWTTLWRVDVKGGRAMELSDKLWRHPAISPDGKWIAGFYADHQLSTQKQPASIAVIGFDGGIPLKVIPIPPSVSISAGIRWSPDGRQLTYVDLRKDGANIWSQPWNGGAPHEVTHFRGDVLFSFDWSRDGKQLSFSRGIQARDVVLIQDVQQK